MTERRVTLHGRVFITGEIRAVTGLHIGGAAGGLEVGGVDMPVIRDPLTGIPYIPGSSVRGKMRSLTEKKTGRVQNFPIQENKVYIHVCTETGAYDACPVCPIFGVPGDKPASSPTRLVVRDAFMSPRSAEQLKAARTDLPYTEVKWEAAIDRVTSAAVPRQIERVPAGTVFEGLEIIYSVFQEEDVPRLLTVIEAMQLLEDDYLGGQGSRGSGKVVFQNLRLYARRSTAYREVVDWPGKGTTVADLLREWDELQRWVRETLFPPQG